MCVCVCFCRAYMRGCRHVRASTFVRGCGFCAWMPAGVCMWSVCSLATWLKSDPCYPSVETTDTSNVVLPMCTCVRGSHRTPTHVGLLKLHCCFWVDLQVASVVSSGLASSREALDRCRYGKLSPWLTGPMARCQNMPAPHALLPTLDAIDIEDRRSATAGFHVDELGQSLLSCTRTWMSGFGVDGGTLGPSLLAPICG